MTKVKIIDIYNHGNGSYYGMYNALIGLTGDVKEIYINPSEYQSYKVYLDKEFSTMLTAHMGYQINGSIRYVENVIYGDMKLKQID